MWRPIASSARVAVEAVGGRVPGGDDPVEVLAQHRVLGAADDLGQALKLELLRFLHRSKSYWRKGAEGGLRLPFIGYRPFNLFPASREAPAVSRTFTGTD